MQYPVNAYIHITEACDHKCDFCYATQIGLGGFGHADVEKVSKIINRCKEYNIKSISIVGGNPVLHPQIMTILKKVRESGTKVILMTNTANFGDADINFVAKNLDVVMVTLHGDTSQLHDSVCKKEGAYDDLMTCLLKLNGLGVEVDLAYNITPYSYDKILSSFEAVIKRGIKVKRYVLQRIAPICNADGQVVKLNEEYCPNKEQVNVAMRQIKTIKEKYDVAIEIVDPYPLCIIDEQYWEFMTPCKCGFTDISINGNGDVTRCGADPNYNLGNILNDSMETIWNKSVELMAFRELSYLPEKCTNCELKKRCRGGCPSSCNTYNMLGESQLKIFGIKP